MDALHKENIINHETLNKTEHLKMDNEKWLKMIYSDKIAK